MKQSNSKRNKKYGVNLAFTLVYMILFVTCDNTINKSVEDGYGRISISCERGGAAPIEARSVLPSTAFDKYEYFFTKESGEEFEGTPDKDGFFTLELGNYTVKIQAYIRKAESYTLAARGESLPFSVVSGGNAPVKVLLYSETTGEKGKFRYTITWPAGSTSEITLKKWPELSNVSLKPESINQVYGVTQTLDLDTGSYLLTVNIETARGELAGISEAVHIDAAPLTTVYTKEFTDGDFHLFRYHAVPYKGPTELNTEFPYSFTYDGYDFFYIYLGKFKNIPLVFGPTHLHKKDREFTYTYKLVKQSSEFFSNEITKSREEAWSITDDHTEARTDGSKISAEIGTGGNIPLLIKIGAEGTREDYISNTTSKYFGVTTSIANTVTYGTEILVGEELEISYDLDNSWKFGYYRYTCFFDADMYLCIVRDSKTKEIVDYYFKDHVIEGSKNWYFDYSKDDKFFGKNDSTVFNVDPSILEIIEESTKPLFDFNNFKVKNSAEWEDALAAIRNGGNGTAGHPKTYTITVDGIIPISGSRIVSFLHQENDFGDVSNVEITLNGNGKLYLTKGGTLLTIGKSQTVIIDSRDLTLQGFKNSLSNDIIESLAGIKVRSGGTLKLYKGNISENGFNGVTVEGGSFIMKGGKISGHRPAGGVIVYEGCFTMTGGDISGNTTFYSMDFTPLSLHG